MNGWDYRALTNNAGGWTQPGTTIAAGAQIYLISNQYSVQTEFSFKLQNLRASFTSTMTSTTPGSNAELIISFTGNNRFGDQNVNYFSYTSDSESAARIECQCIVSNSDISMGT